MLSFKCFHFKNVRAIFSSENSNISKIWILRKLMNFSNEVLFSLCHKGGKKQSFAAEACFVHSIAAFQLCDYLLVVSCYISSQVSDGIPVHLKRGYPDRLLYRTTMALTVGGALYCLVALYIAAQPSNKWPTPAQELSATPSTSHCFNSLTSLHLSPPALTMTNLGTLRWGFITNHGLSSLCKRCLS